MHPFRLERVREPVEAIRAAGRQDGTPPVMAATQFIAGGTNLVDHMRLDAAQPDRLIDLNGLADPALRRIDVAQDAVRFGALVRMADAAAHTGLARRCPMLVQSLALAASPQIRNMASLAGNLLQRTRCEYFREVSWSCNRRAPGSGCAAIGGFDRQHAVLGTSGHCIATYPGDFAQALVALDATVEVLGTGGPRLVPVAELHRLPGDAPHVETVLRADEIVTAIHVPLPRWAVRSHMAKVRDRASFAFALASAAVALDVADGRVREARIALGGVATVPWRALKAEETLRGRAPDEAAATAAADVAFADARPGRHNAFKVDLGRAVLVQALLEAGSMTPTAEGAET